MTKEEILERIRRKIAAGSLPDVPAREIWGGRGTGATCAACDRKIDASEPEIEADCIDDVPRFYHVDCHELMERERGKTPR
jgi:hypothetical protein